LKFEPSELPKISNHQGDELVLSKDALLELMMAVLAKGRGFRFKAKGWSMIPFIRDGDVITVDPITSEPCQLGQVVAFRSTDERCLVVHRIVARTDAGYLIQGDNAMNESDGIIRHEQLLGQVSRVERNGRRIWLGQGPGRVFIAWLSRGGYLAHLRLSLMGLRDKIRKLLPR
jgi:phage repressor protein C with HTH and peptisase S24 domain